MASCRSKLRIAVRALVKTRERPPRRIRRRTLQGVVIKIVSLREGTIGSAALARISHANRRIGTPNQRK